MKYCIFSIILFQSWFMEAQTTDTMFIQVEQETGKFQNEPKLDRYDEIFGYQKATLWCFKINVLSALPNFSDDPVLRNQPDFFGWGSPAETLPKVSLSGEIKLNPAISINGGGDFGLSSSGYFKGKRNTWGAHFEPRWYFKMLRQVKNGSRANNISGNYMALEYRMLTSSDRPPETLLEKSINYTFQSATLRFGMQRRLLKFGFVDLSVGVGQYERVEETELNLDKETTKESNWLIEPRLSAGFALGPAKGAKNPTDWCSVLRCFEEQSHMMKVDFTQVFKGTAEHFIMKPTVSYEQKLGHSSIALETELQFILEKTPYKTIPGISMNLQPKWYFLQKRRIAKGKSGNNLSGLFGGITLGATRQWETEATYALNDDLLYYLAPHVGAQLRLFKHGFVQYKFGVFSQGTQITVEPAGFYAELRAGFAF
ncbi:MAG: hypothetical protein JNJ57_00830 [Saprospiraceae bacterium]|nr:hypothetical protein [Saprospiraceae bacterium]